MKLRIKDFIQLPIKSFSVSHKAWYHDSHSWYKPKVWISWITLTYKFASPRTNKKVMNRLTMQCNTAVTHEITFLRTSKMFDNLRTLTLKNRMLMLRMVVCIYRFKRTMSLFKWGFLIWVCFPHYFKEVFVNLLCYIDYYFTPTPFGFTTQDESIVCPLSNRIQVIFGIKFCVRTAPKTKFRHMLSIRKW